MAKKQQSIYDQLNLSDYKNYDSIPPAKKAWITIKAKQQGKDPDKVHSDIERKMGGSKKTGKKIIKKKVTKKVGKKETVNKIKIVKSDDRTIYYTNLKGGGIKRTTEFEKKKLAKYSCNVGLKCDHDCTYCSTGASLRTHDIFKDINRSSFELGYSILYENLLKKVKESAKSRRDNLRGTVMLCTTVDAWCASAYKLNYGRKCLEAILQETGWDVRILTKNANNLEKDFGFIKKYKDRISVGISITGTKSANDLIKSIEPNASPIKDRFRVMRKAHRLGLRTYGMLCPIMPDIANKQGQVDELVKFCESIGAEEIFCENVNARGGNFILTAEELLKNGYKKESDAMHKIRKKTIWSEYTLNLIKTIQKSVRQYSSIDKFRFLLYSKSITKSIIKQIKADDEGVIWLNE